jgi:hypothetical protein
VIEAAADPVLKREGGAWLIAASIGSEIPVSCILHDKPIDGAGSLVGLVELVKQTAKDITVQEVMPTAAGAIGETAYISATLSYTKPSPRGTLGGQLKMFVRPDLDASLVCFHDEVGYIESFKRVAHGLAQSLKVKQPSPTAQFVEIQVMTLGELPVGFTRRTIYVEATGTTLDQAISCMLLPRTPKDLIPSDRFGAERSDRAGRVLSIDSIEAKGQEVQSQYKATRQGNSRVYVYVGKQSGKDVSGKFKSKEDKGLPSSHLIAGRLRDQLMTGKVAELTIQEYHPTISPQPLDVVYKRKGADAHDVVFRLGQLEASGHLDEQGLVDRVSMPIGGMIMSEARVFVRGKL